MKNPTIYVEHLIVMLIGLILTDFSLLYYAAKTIPCA